MTNKEKVKVGIVGTGFGGFVHLPAFQMCENAELVAVCGRDEGKVNQLALKYNIQHRFNDYKSMLEMEEIDLVSIALPPFFQYEYVDLAIDAGKHVLCEKPFTLNFKQAIKLKEKIEKTNLVGAVGYQMRFQPGRQTIKNILVGGDLGKIIHVNMSYDYCSRLKDNLNWDWWSEKQMGGGVLNAMVSHQIDLLCWWFGEPEIINSNLSIYNDKGFDKATEENRKVTAEELVIANFQFKNSIKVSLSVSSVAIGWRTSSIQIYGNNGALFLDGEEKLTMVRKTTAKHDLTIREHLLSVPWISGSIWRAAFFRQAEALVNSLYAETPYNGATFDDGGNNQRILDQLRNEKG